ncbi:hypothetical protein [Sphaerotilus sp.]|uniref:hypothetical protein n=1 Tax=Sphaerotilus sp. TaxID=2093942 RepID=UPI00286E51F3|nr:hypothetical protein [Sphaerotilus sp.]
MATSEKRRIFLASSAELEADRRAFEIFINRVNKRWNAHGLFLELEIWEDFDSAVSATRKQDDYNAALRRCDLFVLLFWTKVGKYTREEFEAALAQFKATGRPKLYVYRKTTPFSAAEQSARDQVSLGEFRMRLEALEHFPGHYDSVDTLTSHFRDQLDDLAAAGCFGNVGRRLPSADDAPTVSVAVKGDGTAAVGAGALAVGKGGVIVQGDSHGDINTGLQHFAGKLKDSPNWNSDPQAVQEAMRREWG